MGSWVSLPKCSQAASAGSEERKRQGCGGWRDSPVPEAENTNFTKNISAFCAAGTAYLCIDWSDVSRAVPQTATKSAVLPALGRNLHTEPSVC